MNWQKYRETAHCGSIGIGLLDGQYVCTMLRGSKIFFYNIRQEAYDTFEQWNTDNAALQRLMEQGYTEIVDCYADNVEQL